jgi:glyoxylase-like metal-dependent hydrolase (beta-lactamase superfamily II)
MVHSADEELARTGGPRPREASMLPYLRHPAVWRLIAGFARGGGRPQNVEKLETFEDGEILEVPGRPRVIHAPGHSNGCVAFHFAGHGALFVGDVLFTYNVLTGRRGPQIGPSAFNVSSDEALQSLAALEHIEADVVLPGHGEPWTDSPAAAVAAARLAGKS